MAHEQSNRELLALAIIAWDLLLKDCIENEERGADFHETSLRVLRFLESLLNDKPEMDDLRQQYIFNVSEIAARIKLIFSTTPVSDDDICDMLLLQHERLKWLGKYPDGTTADPLQDKIHHLH